MRVELAPIVLQTKERIEIPDFPMVYSLLRVIPDLYKEHCEVILVKLPLATTRATAKSNWRRKPPKFPKPVLQN